MNNHNVTLSPPEWLRWDGRATTFKEIVEDRIQRRGNYSESFGKFVHKFWADDAIEKGVAQLYNIFLPKKLAHEQHGSLNVTLDPALTTPACKHDDIIRILKDIIASVSVDPKPDIPAARGRFLSSFNATRHFRPMPVEGPIMTEWHSGDGSIQHISSADHMLSGSVVKQTSTRHARNTRSTRSTRGSRHSHNSRISSASLSGSQATLPPPSSPHQHPGSYASSASSGQKRAAGDLETSQFGNSRKKSRGS